MSQILYFAFSLAILLGQNTYARDTPHRRATVQTPLQPLIEELPALEPYALHSASFHNDAATIQFLLAQGADPNLPDPNGTTPVLLAIYAESTNALQALLPHCDINHTNPIDGRTPLIAAVLKKRADYVQLILSYSPSFSLGPYNNGGQAIHFAAEKDDTQILNLLHQAGADIDSPRHIEGATPLTLATLLGKNRAAHWLLNHGADLSKAPLALPYAVERCSLGVIEKIVARGVNTNFLTSSSG